MTWQVPLAASVVPWRAGTNVHDSGASRRVARSLSAIG